MGRKIDMKKIEDVTKCQVTFSKRRSSLMKKANEIAICCDVDVAFVAFSPSGRISKFCNKKRIEDVLHRYVDLPAESRLREIDDVQNLELQIKKSGLELQILEANLRDYELDPEQEPSLHLLSWCERNINHSLERVLARKLDSRVLQNQDHEISFSSNLMENELNSAISPLLSAKVQVQGIINPDLDTPNTSNLPISFQNSQQATFSNAFYNSIPNLSNMPPPRSTPSAIFTGYGSTQYATCNFTNKDDTIQTSSQYAACNFTDKGEETSQSNILNGSKQEGTSGDNTCWTSKIQKSSLWEWEDLLIDDNFNIGISK
ncbi:agamous-like MADS-box protein AGL8 homolog [Salvia hispanica]|uniref:agamous-like MADS-box protein AGL8 homolog n=1 Tax=Salvia hispanica TaxID=49212 RepID=UPI00200945DF|nr:agamous-like MADS-box protein AGL8 homolog [Salvia hispanica]